MLSLFTTPYPILDLGSGLKPPQNNMLALVSGDGACCFAEFVLWERFHAGAWVQL